MSAANEPRTKRPIPGLSPTQSRQARDLKDYVVNLAEQIAGDDEAARRRVLTFLRNRFKVILDGVSAPQKVKQTPILRKQQNNICRRCGLPLPDDPDAVEKHRLDRNVGYDDLNNIELRHRECHRSEHADNHWS